jgi:hypothetical protein
MQKGQDKVNKRGGIIYFYNYFLKFFLVAGLRFWIKRQATDASIL